MMWYNLYVVILGELKLQLNMRMWRNRQTRWLRVMSRQCIYNLSWLKRIYRFDICGATCKKVHLGFGFEPCKNFRSLYCGCGGIGRRAGFRCQSSQGGMGSSPFIRTTYFEKTSAKPRFFQNSLSKSINVFEGE